MKNGILIAIVAVVGLSACLTPGNFAGEGEPCDEDQFCGSAFECIEGTCRVVEDDTDMGSTGDAANSTPDAANDPDMQSSECGGGCSGPTPVCDTDSDECVPCLGDEDCRDGVCSVGVTSADNVCVQCRENADCDDGVCDTVTNSCVTCLDNADCTEANAAKCDVDPADSTNNVCVACDDSSQCAGISGTEICGSSGECVQCTDESETTRAACGGNACDPATNTCTSTPTGSLSACGNCVADSECPSDHRCVPMDFDGQFHGNYCLKLLSTGCAPPYSDSITAVSLSGAPSADYCSLKTALTTCEAVDTFLDDCGSAADCGAANVSDAKCEAVDTITGNECTYSCVGSNDCGDGAACTGGTSGDRWCE